MSVPSRPALVVFDLAGTTIQDRGEVPEAFREALGEHGLEAKVRWNIAVLTGAHERRALEAAPHTHIISSIADLATVWE